MFVAYMVKEIELTCMNSRVGPSSVGGTDEASGQWLL